MICICVAVIKSHSFRKEIKKKYSQFPKSTSLLTNYNNKKEETSNMGNIFKKRFFYLGVNRTRFKVISDLELNVNDAKNFRLKQQE